MAKKMFRLSISTNLRNARRLKSVKAANVAVLSTKVDSFLSGASSIYVEQMYDQWRADPTR